MWLGCCGISNLQVLLETRQSAWLKWHVEEHALDEILDEIFWVLTMFLFTLHTMSVANTGNFLEVGSFWLGSGSRWVKKGAAAHRKAKRTRTGFSGHALHGDSRVTAKSPTITNHYSSLSLFSPAKVTELLPRLRRPRDPRLGAFSIGSRGRWTRPCRRRDGKGGRWRGPKTWQIL